MRLKSMFVLFCAVLLGSGIALAQAEVYHVSGEELDEGCLSDLTGGWATEAMACVGEDVCWEGSYKWRYTLVFDPNGRVHYQETANDSGMVAFGVESGEKYHRVGADTYTYSGDGEPPIVEHFSRVFPLIGQGSNGKLLFHYLWKITINANAEVTVVKEDRWVECK